MDIILLRTIPCYFSWFVYLEIVENEGSSLTEHNGGDNVVEEVAVLDQGHAGQCIGLLGEWVKFVESASRTCIDHDEKDALE